MYAMEKHSLLKHAVDSGVASSGEGSVVELLESCEEGRKPD